MLKTFNVEGMTCAACSSAVERILNKLEPVTSASVNLTTKKLTLEYDEQTLPVEQILSKIEKAGFTATEILETKTVTMPIDGMT